jgi:hypothetical protein
MKFEYAEDICDALKDRETWETRQETWYKMRHTGLRRINPPYPGAADLHFPLIDALVERMKPFYYKQLFATDQFAAFVSLRTQPSDTTSAVASWFDYRLKQKSNFQRKILTTIDAMLMAGRAPIKIYWDYKQKKLCFNAIAPTYFIIPNDVDELQEAPWVCHVLLMSVEDYKANSAFRQDPDFIEKIKGTSTSEMGIHGMGTHYDTIKRREGITFTKTDQQVILWEVYYRENGKIYFETYSPQCFEEKDCARPRQSLAYSHGNYPFCSLRSEIKDEGWYSPRGIPEIVAAFEDSLSRQWNFKHDYMDFVNKPLFKNTQGMGNTGVVSFLPGSSLPQGLEPAVMPAPPISFDQEMQMTRSLAEYRVAIPDLGATEHMASRPGSRGDITATQIQAIIGQSGLSDDMRSRVFRLDCGDIFNMCFSLYKQYDGQSLTYVLYDTVGQVPPDALQGEYEIMPNGAADSWNKPQQLQKAIARLQLLGNSPFWKRNELEKNFVEIDDPRLIKRAYTDPGIEMQNQMEQQAQEISIMLLGFPATVKPSDDDKAHIQSLKGYVEAELAQQKPIDPKTARLLLGHSQGHMQALDQKKDPALNQVRQMTKPLFDFLQQIAMSDQAPPQNVIPGPGSPQMGQEPPKVTDLSQVEVDKSKVQSDRVSDATKVADAVSNLIKSGVEVTQADINKVLTDLGLPPITPFDEPAVPPETHQNIGPTATESAP